MTTETVTAAASAATKAKDIALFADKQFDLASSYVIDNDVMYEAAGTDLQTIANAIKKANERRLEITRPLDAAKESVMSLFRAPIQRLEKASDLLRASMLTYRKQKDEEARLAREAAEKAERDRIAELEAKAAKAKSAAKKEEILEQIEAVKEAPPLPVVSAPQAAGISGRKTWKVSSVDKAQLIIACAQRLANGDDSLLPYLEVNASELATTARALKANTRIPGVTVEEVESLTVRS